MDCESGYICDASDYSFGEEHEMDFDTYYLSDALKNH